MLAPAGTPPEIVAKLNWEIVAILQLADTRESFARLGALSVGNSSAQFAAEIKSEIALWGKVIRAAGIKGD